MLLKPILDIGIDFLALLRWGIPFALVSLAIVIPIEAWFLKEYLNFAFKRTLMYSLVMNVVSSLLGIPLVLAMVWFEIPFIYLSLPEVCITIILLVFPFFLTLIIEFGTLRFLVKPCPPRKKLLTAVFKTNLISYILLAFTYFMLAVFQVG